MPSTKTLHTASDCAAILASVDHLLLDCDGVLWQQAGQYMIPGTMAALNALEEAGKTISFLTNRPTESAQHYVEVMSRHGYNATLDQIFCTPRLAAIYLADVLPKGKAVLSIGYKAMDETLMEAGYKVYTSGESQPLMEDWISTCPVFQPEMSGDIGAVVVGTTQAHWGYIGSDMYPKTLAYLKSHPDIPLIILSGESVFKRIQEGQPKEVNEQHTLFIEAGRVPVHLGKPEKLFMDLIRKTDVKFGNSIGMKTLLVNSGGDRFPEPLLEVDDAPTYFSNSIPEFIGKGLNHQSTLAMLPRTNEFIKDSQEAWAQYQVERAKQVGMLSVASFAKRWEEERGKKI